MTEALAYTADELAPMLGVTSAHLRRMGHAGAIPMRSLGGRLLFPKAAVHRWLEQGSAA